MGLYYEDFHIGQQFTSPGRTITETDVVNFAGISGDYNPLHTDECYAQNTVFKRRIAHGVLGVSIVTGLTARMGIFEGTVIGLLEIEKWKFLKPIYLGDTVRVEMAIVEKIETSKKDRGLVVRQIRLTNQNNEIVQEGLIKVMIKKKQQ